jgi:Na+-transporting NADH:ubiquinone oxidoreductase subunit C
MKSFSNMYIFLFSTAMVTIVAVLLSFVSEQLRPIQEKNVEVEKKLDILRSVGLKKDMDAFTVDMKVELDKPEEERNLPIFVYTAEDSTKKYIFPLRGTGLWGPIWGYIALYDDYNTIYGAIFKHSKETPGLGAEINESWFQEQFENKTIFDENGNFVSVEVVKGGAKPDDPHAVDAISGGTITSTALEEMLRECLVNYVQYFKTIKDNQNE